MITIYRVDHVSQVVAEIEPQAELLEGLFGFVPVREWESESEGCRGRMYELPDSRGQKWELLEPFGEGSPLNRFLDSPRGPGLHHIAVETNDIKAALGELDRLGLEPIEAASASESQWFDIPIAPPTATGGGSDSEPSGLMLRLYGAPIERICGEDGTPKPAPAAGGARREETIGIKELLHICQATSDLDELASWNGRILGMNPIFRTPEGKHPDMATMMLTLPGSQIIWELIAPVGEESFIDRFVEKRGEASCHHVTFEVDDWDRAMAACDKHGVPTFGENSGETDGAKWRDAFIHPKHAGGVLVQIYHEERPGVWMRSDKIPAVRKAAWS